VANAGVGAGANQLVAFFDLHFGAPIFADGAAGPDGEEDPCGTKGATEPRDPEFVGNEAVIERAPIEIFLVEQDETGGHEDQVEDALGGVLAFCGSLYAESGDGPVEGEEEPESAEDLSGSNVHCCGLRDKPTGAALFCDALRETLLRNPGGLPTVRLRLRLS
jgi:hypothetical protein